MKKFMLFKGFIQSTLMTLTLRMVCVHTLNYQMNELFELSTKINGGWNHCYLII